LSFVDRYVRFDALAEAVHPPYPEAVRK
jgi:hypothetical protein